jgi:hypothetical protein
MEIRNSNRETIRPVYFPHTYMSPAAAEAIRTAFATVAAYQPVAGRRTPDMQALAASGFLELLVPVPEDAEGLERSLEELDRWGRLQQGGAGLLSVFLSGRSDLDPLTADGSAGQIAAEVRRRPVDAQPAQEAVRRAAVFLQLAHQVDQQSTQVSAELERCEAAHADLLDALAGEDGRPARASASPPAAGSLPEEDLLLTARIRAWARLYLRRPCAGPVFVTVSPEVVRLLAEACPGLRRIERSALDRMAAGPSAGGAPGSADFMAQLLLLAARPLPAALAADAGGSSGPAVYLVPDEPPRRLFARLAESPAAPAADDAAGWRHTVIVQLDRRGVPLGRS